MTSTHPDDHVRVDDIQGDVIPGLKKLNHVFLFIHSKDEYNLWNWLREARSELTSAFRILTADDCGSSSETFRALAVTYAGLSKLNADLAAEADEFRAFRIGAASRAARLRETGSSAPKAWLFGGQQSPKVHIVLRLASNSDTNIVQAAKSVQTDLRKQGLQILWMQWGRRLGSESAPREHFGFREDLSQPQVGGLPQPFSAPPAGAYVSAGEFLLGLPREARGGGHAGGWPCPNWMTGGSFCVIRRLRQNVAAFWTQVQELARYLGSDPEVIAAKIVGRFRDGTPLASGVGKKDRKLGTIDSWDFDYNDDPLGRATPPCAHIRKMYLRLTSFEERNRHRLLRRSIPFGPPLADRNQDEGKARGLIFCAYMSSIEEQFEHLLHGWANNADFPQPADGPDALIGQSKSRCRMPSKERLDIKIALAKCISTEGGLYAFTPSFSGLDYILERSNP